MLRKSLEHVSKSLILGRILMLSTLGKICSRQHFDIFFSYVSNETGFDISGQFE